MELKLFDTMERQLVPFRFRNNQVNMYVCGPTTYSPPHVGHARSYIIFDTLAKYLRYNGLDVKYVQNITDMGKNIKRRADEMGCAVTEIVDQFEKEYFQVMDSLNVDSVDIYERSSANIDLIVSQIDRMLESGSAYRNEDGVFFDTTKHLDFGAILNKQRHELELVMQHLKKRDCLDFSLWDFDSSWGVVFQSKYGLGKPHWHIQDTAIAEKHFWDTCYDIHGAGTDCIYPHHESIRLVLRSLSGNVEPVNFWLHNGLVNVNGEKMSKSSNNSISADSILRKYGVPAVRCALLAIDYRMPIEFDEIHFDEWAEKTHGLELLVGELCKNRNKNVPNREYGIFTPYEQKFMQAMDDNMNISAAISVAYLFAEEIRTRINDRNMTRDLINQAYSLLYQFDYILGLGIIKNGGKNE